MSDQRRVLVVLGVAIGLTAFSWANYSAVLPFILDDLQLSGAEGGIVYSAYFAGYLLVIIPAGILVDRYSARRLVGLTSIGTGLFGIAFAFLTVDVVSGSLWRFAAGACFAGIYVPGMRMLSDWFGTHRRGRAIGTYVGTLTVGSGIAYPLSTWLAANTDWRLAMAITSAWQASASSSSLSIIRMRAAEGFRSIGLS